MAGLDSAIGDGYPECPLCQRVHHLRARQHRSRRAVVCDCGLVGPEAATDEEAWVAWEGTTWRRWLLREDPCPWSATHWRQRLTIGGERVLEATYAPRVALLDTPDGLLVRGPTGDVVGPVEASVALSVVCTVTPLSRPSDAEVGWLTGGTQ